MPATFKIVLAAKADSDGLFDVRLRVTADRVVRYLNTGVAVAAKHWNPKATLDKENWIKTSHHDHAEHNETLYSWVRRGKKLATAHPDWSADQLKATLQNGDIDPAAPDFLTFCYRRLDAEQATLDEAHRKGRETTGWSQGTIDGYRPVINKLAAWLGGKPLPLPLLTTELVQRYQQHLERDLDNGPTTTNKNLRVLHTFIREAIRAKLLTLDKDPMALYDFPTPKPKRVWLTREELDELAAATLAPAQHAARTVFLLQYYAHGSRIGAILKLKWKDRRGGRLRFVMDKGGRVKEVEETEELQGLLDTFTPAPGQPRPHPESYILPFLPADFEQLHPKQQLETIKRETAKINMNLARAAARLKWTKRFSSHVSRRTLATFSERLLKGDLRQVGGLLGHTNTRTTQLYLKDLDTHVIDDAARQVYGSLGKTQVKQPLAAGEQPASNTHPHNPEKAAS
ncbi:tyrosine-type recombinase/integrase [Hymenobacter sp. 15J16-1T3B]|uniref:tyrosine-type recombinase/integrase n=1 Tax=Hymenobacter sp. 15J16-1T3B TaxID=2886941 RepID=UPI001D11458A|nr:tyrosine-type recombinase/integrase [Hymenobacter sp. 15J16-1T3B]MCC3159477.1 tyrosine-type recombinase/integrase [Hymenobacter sp. 15J16-1T3B]